MKGIVMPDKNGWNSIKEDGYPDIKKPLWYFFEMLGTFHGEYIGAFREEIDYRGKHYSYDVHYFGGKHGFLGDDVSHWQYGDPENKPSNPEGFDG